MVVRDHDTGTIMIKMRAEGLGSLTKKENTCTYDLIRLVFFFFAVQLLFWSYRSVFILVDSELVVI